MVHKIILQLMDDHHRIDELLNLLAQEITVFESGDDFDSHVVLAILDYLQYQPDLFHHPLEELIFDRLWSHAELQPVIKKLQDEHSELTSQTKYCRTFFIRWAREGELWDRMRASRSAEGYIEIYRRHIALEEREILPFAADALTESDWKEVDEYAIAAAPSADPVFGPTVMERYRDIRRKIQKKLG